jgi:Uma2 family endonuclease
MSEPVRHLFTVSEYAQLGDAGVFPAARRLELLEGEIVEMVPINPPHAAVVARLNRFFSLGLPGRAIVLVQSPVVLSDLSQPQPDVALLRARDDFYATAHPRPEDILLCVEVADSTARFDRSVKRPLLAAAGILELWIVDIPGRVVDVATDPGPDGYRRLLQAHPGDRVSPVAFPDFSVTVADLFA